MTCLLYTSIIWNYLAKYDYLQPKVPDLDEIVPLPPAKLPKWDGKSCVTLGYGYDLGQQLALRHI